MGHGRTLTKQDKYNNIIWFQFFMGNLSLKVPLNYHDITSLRCQDSFVGLSNLKQQNLIYDKMYYYMLTSLKVQSSQISFEG